MLASEIVRLAHSIWRELLSALHPDGNLLGQAIKAVTSIALNFGEAGGHRSAGMVGSKLNIARGESYEVAVACHFLEVAASDARRLAMMVDAYRPPVDASLEHPAELKAVP